MNEVVPQVEVCFGAECSYKGSRELAKELVRHEMYHRVTAAQCAIGVGSETRRGDYHGG